MYVGNHQDATERLEFILDLQTQRCISDLGHECGGCDWHVGTPGGALGQGESRPDQLEEP